MYEIFKKIEMTSGKTTKIQVIQDNAHNEGFKFFLNFLYNDMITTGLSAKKIDKKLNRDYLHTIRGFETPQGIMEHVSKFNTGTDNIIEVCQVYLRGLEEPYQTFMKEVLTKSYKCGITATSVNKAIKGLIPVFQAQLAHSYDKFADKIAGEEIVITQKLDGHRTLMFYDGDKVTFRTRKGHEIKGLNELEAEVKSFFPVAVGRSIVIDGEITIADSSVPIDKVFQSTSKIIRKDGIKSGLKFHVFDILPEDEFWSGESTATHQERRDAINHLFAKSSFKPKLVELVEELYRGRDHDMIAKLMKTATDNGWEGLMINLDKPYLCKRNSGLLKVKKFHSGDLEVLSVFEGEGKYKGMLGGITVDFKGTSVDCGTGFTDYERSYYWSNQDEIIGKIVEIKYFEESTNQNDSSVSLRFPVFQSLRFDKDKRDINID